MASHPLALDPRTKLFMLLLANLLLFFHVHTHTEIMLVALTLLPMLPAGRWRMALRLGVTYAVLVAVSYLVPADSPNPWLHLLALLAVGLRMMMPCFITGAYAFSTTRTSEFVCAMRRMHVPETIVIPCMVVIRFFPTIVQDYRQIRAAMALRGVAEGRFALVRHPMQSLEYVLVPLMMNAANVAQDLSVAALTKGLGRPGTHTSLTMIRMRPLDWLTMIVCATPLVLDIIGVL
ncbi:energy-coupling factor transporter transmembrane component T [Bifidobacterium callimiconis]|uniref:Cobalt ABC transporter permease n=1 Tax=Bifidobacterium callimiconis TaxID=2306973 RepID=A0A430FIH4_9BIFI|nr:energy-coupling factor transporter transmembrane component T [Bifidobacterium callimiconis]RSX52600.1 cobalt ABC transporter permease [Bifidobacterium callimiconis]